ncbi:MAG: hypothetical protein N4A53_07535 [Pelagimonas sp.]|jgi:hypothetical protein|nr:hypothetical protein [Pelagimonas sp.]
MAKIPPEHVNDVLDFYSEQVIPSLAAALATGDAFPKEVLNEIRNSYTHLARAHKLECSDEDHARELDAAQRHLKRTCIDCMKVCIFDLASRSETAVKALTEDIQLPADIYKTTGELRRKRRELSAYEGQAPTHNAIEQYQSLFEEYQEFYLKLDEQFQGETAEMRRKAREQKSHEQAQKARKSGIASGIIYTIITGIVASLIATGIWEAIN